MATRDLYASSTQNRIFSNVIELRPGSEQSAGNRKSEETRPPQNQYAQGFSLPPV